MESLKTADVVIAAATFIGPIAAVQAQKWVERFRETRQRKRWIFETLMGTRGARLALDHVKALNMIELAFYGRHIFGVHTASRKEKTVLEAWTVYLKHLNSPFPTGDVAAGGGWNASYNALFVNLLVAIAANVGYRLVREQLGGGGYTTVAQINAENEQGQVRKLLIEVLGGAKPLNVQPFNQGQP